MIENLLKLLGLWKEPTIETITSPMAQIVRKLEDYALAQSVRAEADEKLAADLIRKSREESARATDARCLADRYSALTLAVPAE
jgi:hypothetical protein